jgi:hypothetical protein
MFDRAGNEFCKSVFDKLKTRGKDVDIPQTFGMIRDGLETIASKSIIDGMGFGEKYVSIHPKDNYIEFRSAGGEDYFSDIAGVVTGQSKIILQDDSGMPMQAMQGAGFYAKDYLQGFLPAFLQGLKF